MKKHIGILIVLILILGCSDSTAPDQKPMIKIEILQDGTIQETFNVTEEETGDIYPIEFDNQQIGEVEIISFEQVYSLPEEENPEIIFKVLSSKDNYYSKFNGVNHFDTLRIDYQLDFDIINENMNCGILYDPIFGYIKDTEFSVWKDSILIDSIYTDSLGRFETEIEADYYFLRNEIFTGFFEIEFHLIEGYADYQISYYNDILKPNIYIYPLTNISLNVEMLFPHSGEVTKSIPEFPDHWHNLQVNPSGRINDKYTYLFYESIQPSIFQKSRGWVIKRENLKEFFTNNLLQTGYNQVEIFDFIEYWIPRLMDSDYYALYPQYNKQLDPLIELNFSIQPDKILRLTYYVVKLKSNEIELEKPEIPFFERTGFVVTEWGLIFDESEKDKDH